MYSLLFVLLLLQVAISSSTNSYSSNPEFPDGVNVVGDGPVESCFKTITRKVSDDDDDDDDDDDESPVAQQVTQQCCEGWYTPEGKQLCSAKKRAYAEQNTATGCDRCGDLESRLERLEKLLTSGQSTGRGSSVVGYLFIRYLKEKIASLEEVNKKQEEKIKYLEEQMVNITTSFTTVEVVEFTEAPVEREALSTADPCDAASCPDYPEAMCMVTSRCGKDVVVFVDEDLKTVKCNSNEPCDLLPPTFCPDDPCQGVYCDGYPDAICVVTECDCKPSFMLPDGSKPICANADTFTYTPTSATISVLSS